MTRQRLGLVPAVLAVLAAGACSDPGQHGQGADTLGTNAGDYPVKVLNAYVERPEDGRYTPGENAKVFFTVSNTGDRDVTLTGVSSPAVRQMDLRWDEACDGTAESVPHIPVLAKASVPIPPGRVLAGHLPYYADAVGFTGEVLAGTTVPMTFTFDGTDAIKLDAKVQPREPIDAVAHYACIPVGVTAP
ncbi:copper chaperone PCu(A)C [Amycolatopsis thermoflava]|uniref:copper chaperone PCu(A)C n=1 Tax=Amycolatopsis thermoflava TaxID=84480 RepID=UPI003EBCB1BE